MRGLECPQSEGPGQSEGYGCYKRTSWETEAGSEEELSVADWGRPEDLAFFISPLSLHDFVNFMTSDKLDAPLQASGSHL